MARIKVDLSRARCCAKCGKQFSVFRHHMGYDSFVGKFNRTVKRRYFLYLDCCLLCNECHMRVHYQYQYIIREHSDFTHKGALLLRTKLIEYCQSWLAGEPPFEYEPDEDFIQEWELGYAIWKKGQSAKPGTGSGRT